MLQNEIEEVGLAQSALAKYKGVRESSIEAGLIDEKTFDDGIKGLYRTTATDGVFCYTFFKAIAIRY